MKPAPKNILVMRYRFIGDTVLTIPFLRNLRHAEPQAHIAWMVAPGSSEVVKGVPYVDEMIYWDPLTIHADSRGSHRTLSAKIVFLQDLRHRHFDKVYVLKRSLSSAVIAWLSGASERIGFDTEGRGLLLTTRVPYRHDRHEVKNFLAVLTADGINVKDDFLEIWTSPEEEERIARILADAGATSSDRIAAIHPFSAVTQRGWPLENYAELAARLGKAGNFRTLILGGPGDVGAFTSVKQLFGDSNIDLVGKCSLREHDSALKAVLLVCGKRQRYYAPGCRRQYAARSAFRPAVAR